MKNLISQKQKTRKCYALKSINEVEKEGKMNISVKIDGKTYQVEIKDIETRPVIAIIDGEKFEVGIKEFSGDYAIVEVNGSVYHVNIKSSDVPQADAPALPNTAPKAAAPKPARSRDLTHSVRVVAAPVSHARRGPK